MDIFSLFSLEGKKAIVTGASQGIGAATAIGLAEAGADVAVVFRGYTEGAKAVEDAITRLGRKVRLIQTDISKEENVESMVKTVANEFGRVDILVNNAGINLKKAAEDFDDETFMKVLNVNLFAAFHSCREAGKIMIKQGGGVIINVTSLVSHLIIRNDHQVAYNTSKGGLVMMTKGLADEWARYNIRVNAIAPGFTKTQLCPDGPTDKNTIPISRLASTREMVGTMIYLASEASSYVTGQEIFVDGGWSICGSEAGGIPAADGYKA